LKGFDKLTNSINFRKVSKVYILVSLILLFVAVISALYVFREKAVFSLEYFKIDSMIDKSGIDTSLKVPLKALSDSTGDIKDILLLDKNNNVIYSSKNSGISKNNKVTFTMVGEKRDFLEDMNAPGVFYKVVGPEKLVFTKDFYVNPKHTKTEYTNDFFYETNFDAKKVYFLNYFADENNGMKIYIISDNKSIPYAEQLIEAIYVLLTLILIIYWLLIALWVYNDAYRRNLNAPIWGLLILFTNLVGLMVYTIYKQNNQTCYKCGSLQNKLNTFCSRCGIRINDSCANCGSKVAKGDDFCTQCGTKLAH
jgi:hypothetical protein